MPGSQTLSLDLDDLSPDHVAELIEHHRQLVVASRTAVLEAPDDDSWRDAPSTGWTLKLVDMLREHLESRGATVQLAAFDRAIENGGFVSRKEVYDLGGYPETRKLNNWTQPINNYAIPEGPLVKAGLDPDADWPIETEYGPGTGYRPAIGFNVAPEIVKLVRER